MKINNMNNRLLQIINRLKLSPKDKSDLVNIIQNNNTNSNITEVTYEELVELRDNNKLIAGMQYRITDYVTTTAQENTRSAGHPFDVIVTADNENTLNEVARACLHDGDTYFTEAGANLAAWQIWYCLDNDVERFAWADAENGKGVIYRMIDEWNNDIPYDFKNIKYVEEMSFECSQYGMAHTYTKNGEIVNIGSFSYYGYTRTRTSQGPPPPPEVIYVIDEIPTTFSNIYIITDGTVLLYSSASIVSVVSRSGEFYTFDAAGNDASVKNNVECYNNVICTHKNGQQKLNKIIFSSVDSNNFNCNNNSFGNNCNNNSFGNNCNNNSFGSECNNNSFGNNCNNNSFGNHCFNNNFGEYSQNNSFGNICYSNSLGRNCEYNSFGALCSFSTFGNNCNYNSLGINCYNVVLDDSTNNKTASVNSNGEVKVFNLADLIS